MPLSHLPRSRSLPIFRRADAERLEPRTLLADGPASLVKDLNTATASSVPTSVVALGGLTLFRADDGVHGNEWFRTDGTAAGTSLLADINPGEAASSVVPSAPAGVPTTAVVGGTMFFAAFEPATGVELWKTDGTPQGTALVKDIHPGTARSTPMYLTAVGGAVYFTADDGEHGVELWKSDGTAAGTVMVTDLAEGSGSPRPVPLGALGGRLIFAADWGDPVAALGREPWVTDGTPAGTTLLKNINPVGSSNPGVFSNATSPPPGVEAVAAGGSLYFAATDPTNGRELWKTDGTPEGTVLVANLNPGTASTNPHDLTAVGDTLYFVGNTSNGNAVFRTRPAGGAELVQAVNASNHTTGSVGGAFYILTQPPSGAAGLYRHNPASPAGTPMTLVRPMAVSFADGEIQDANSVALFIAPGTAADTASVWRSDGTAAGTVQVATYAANALDAVGAERRRLRPGGNGVYYFSAFEPRTGVELYRTDGTAAGTGRLLDLNRDTVTGVFTAVGFVNGPAGGRALFTGLGDTYFGEPWATDGTAAGTAVLKDIWPGDEPGISSAGPIVGQGNSLFSPEINGKTYFIGRQESTGLELWVTDGTPGGTHLVKDRVPGPDSGGTGWVMPFRGAAHFFDNFNDIYTTDGTAAGTTRVVDFDDGLVARNVVAVGDTLYVFAWRNPGGGTELWKTDGTQAGTSLVKVIAPSGNVIGTETAPVAVVNGRIYFITQTGQGRPTLWASDGTGPGTSAVAELPEFTGTLTQMKAAGGRVLFEAGVPGATDSTQTTLWIADASGARPLADVAPGAANLTKVQGLSSGGNVAYFFAQPPGTTGLELWRTDGTAAGTVRLKDASTAPAALNVVDGVFYFNATDATHGRELWRSDGTPAGTVLLQDVRPGPFGSDPRDLAAAGDRIYFHADDGEHGHELYSMPRAAAAPSVVGRSVFYNDSAFDGRDPAATAADLAAVATDKAALRPGETSSTANVTSYDKGINGVLIEFAGAPPAALSADDFEFRTGRGGDPTAWAAAPAPASVVLLPGPAGAVTRYAITWPAGAVVNTWLRITVKANDRTGLAAPDVFSFGNLVGEVGNGTVPVVNALDLLAVRRNFFSSSGVTGRFDFDRDGKVSATDFAIARSNYLSRLAAAVLAPAVQSSLPFPDPPESGRTAKQVLR
jgi:ELWxxDGT repeat protein